MINFTTMPKVAFEEMNRVHSEEVELLNTLELLLEGKENDEQIENILETLLEHTREHFSNEERLMEEVNFPAYMMHKSEHTRVLNETQLVILDWRTKRDNSIIKNYFLGTLTDWLPQHIASMDTITAQFICMHKGC